jgi:hypothetical protein
MLVPVWIDGWQQECCGDAVAMGDAVSWTLAWEASRQGWLSRLLGDRYPDWAMDLTVDTVVVASDVPPSQTGWAIVRRGQLAISVAWPQARAGRVPGDSLTVRTPAKEHHGGVPDVTPLTAGVVRRIRIVRCQYVPEAPGSRSLVPVTGTATLADTSQVPRGVVALDEDTGDHEGRFVGYLVDLKVDTDREIDGDLSRASAVGSDLSWWAAQPAATGTSTRLPYSVHEPS